MIFKLKCKFTGRTGSHLDAEYLIAKFADFFTVLPSELAGVIRIIRKLNDLTEGVLSEISAW